MGAGDALARVRQAAEEHDCRPYGDGAGFRARCPVHGSRGLTLSVSQGRVGALITCFAGCEKNDVLAALGLSWDDAFDEPRQRSSPAWRPSQIRRPATAISRLIEVVTRAVSIINLRTELEAAEPRKPLTAEQRIILAEEGCRRDADDHYWRTLARWHALASDDAYIRRARATRPWTRSHEQHAVLLIRRGLL